MNPEKNIILANKKMLETPIEALNSTDGDELVAGPFDSTFEFKTRIKKMLQSEQGGL